MFCFVQETINTCSRSELHCKLIIVDSSHFVTPEMLL